MSKQRKCWIVRDQDGLRISDDKPKFWPVEVGGLKPGYFETHCTIALEGHCPPQLRKMWRKALKGKRGKAAIVECVWETWVPIIEIECGECRGEGRLRWIRVPTGFSDRCPNCKGTGRITRPMLPGDL